MKDEKARWRAGSLASLIATPEASGGVGRANETRWKLSSYARSRNGMAFS